MTVQGAIRQGHSCALDALTAAREFHTAVAQPDMALVVFFCSSEYDLDALGSAIAAAFTGIQVIGCTTAGEIGPAGYRDRSLSGASFPQDACTAVSGCVHDLQHFDIEAGQTLVQSLLQKLERLSPSTPSAQRFAFLLVDGLCQREEIVASVLQAALGEVSLCGGSAGDGLRFARTHVYHEGRFHADSAVLLLAATALPFRIFKTQHFVASEEQLVVTAANPEHRIVYEINGLPAAAEYARIAGVKQQLLDPAQFASYPVVVMIDGTEYVRSIQKINTDGSLTFYCAIDEGVVLRTAHGIELVKNLTQAFEGIRDEIGPPQLVLGCDCILRNLEITQQGLKSQVEQVFRDNNTVGFSTYGEQFHGVHVNQTLTAIAIGAPRQEPT